MSLSETMTALMDKARKLTGLTEKISIARLTSLMNHFDLHVNPNLLPQTEFILNNDGYWESWNTFGKLKIKPNTDYTVSWRSKTSGKNTNVRIRIYDLKDADSNNFIVGPFEGYEFPLTSERQSLTFKVPADHPYDIAFYGNGSDRDSLDHTPVTFYDCKLEAGDLATPLNSTKLLSNRYTSELIDIFNYSDFQKWNISADLKVTLNENDGSATITQSNVQITHDERLFSPNLPVSIDEHMTAIIVAKISADCSENSVSLSVGAYDAGAWVAINSKNYKVYTVPLMSSVTTHFSMYVNPDTQSIVGDLIDIKSLIIMDSHFLRDSTS